MIGLGIAFNPCYKCDEKAKCNICELTYHRNGQLVHHADVVEVVRCKDCKNCNQLYLCKLKGGEAELAYTCRVIDKRVSPNHYCRCGERSEDK